MPFERVFSGRGGGVLDGEEEDWESFYVISLPATGTLLEVKQSGDGYYEGAAYSPRILATSRLKKFR